MVLKKGDMDPKFKYKISKIPGVQEIEVKVEELKRIEPLEQSFNDYFTKSILWPLKSSLPAVITLMSRLLQNYSSYCNGPMVRSGWNT